MNRTPDLGHTLTVHYSHKVNRCQDCYRWNMTKIVASHRLAQKAVLAVSTILNNAGALTETVANDYGEDLLVQTQNADAADPFHILIQVKGTTLKLGKDGARAFQFEIAHLRRWIGHIQPVLVCVFDDLTGSIFAFYPRNQFSLWALATTSKRRMTVRLTDEMKFNSSTALVFIWQCRIEYFDRMLSWYDSRAQDAYLAPIPSRVRTH